MIFYYTATGNCLYAAKQLGGQKLVSIPQALKNGELSFEDDVIGIVSPDYAAELPLTVRTFLEKAELKANYIFMIATYGMDDSVVAEWQAEFAEKNGIHVDYSNVLLMVDNYLPAFDMDEQVKIDKKVDEQIAAIKADLAERKKYIKPSTEEGRALYKIVQQRGIEMPHWNSGEGIVCDGQKCVGCGICVKVCPIGNNGVKDGKMFRKNSKCDFCLACLHACPQLALGLTTADQNPQARYRNEHISLREIIDANCQE